MQEGDVQIKGYPVRLPLMSSSCSRRIRRLHGARQDRDPSQRSNRFEIKTHYPASLAHGVAITEQEAWMTATPAGQFSCRNSSRQSSKALRSKRGRIRESIRGPV
jgi:magnesium chelatase subunit I